MPVSTKTNLIDALRLATWSKVLNFTSLKCLRYLFRAAISSLLRSTDCKQKTVKYEPINTCSFNSNLLIENVQHRQLTLRPCKSPHRFERLAYRQDFRSGTGSFIHLIPPLEHPVEISMFSCHCVILISQASIASYGHGWLSWLHPGFECIPGNIVFCTRISILSSVHQKFDCLLQTTPNIFRAKNTLTVSLAPQTLKSLCIGALQN